MTSPIINLSALEPLYLPHEMPSFHRIRSEREGESAKGLINELLLPLMPGTPVEQKAFFEPYYGALKKGDIDWLNRHAGNLRRTLVFKNGLWPLGLLLFCLDYSKGAKYEVSGVFEAIKKSFEKIDNSDLYVTVKAITDLRNSYIAHQEKELTDINLARKGLIAWVIGIYKIYFAHHQQEKVL